MRWAVSRASAQAKAPESFRGLGHRHGSNKFISATLGQVLVDGMQSLRNQGLALAVFTMQPLDQLAGWSVTLVVRVMLVAEVELAIGRRMVAHPPAALLVAVELPGQLIHSRDDCSDEAELGQIRPEAGPECIIGSRLVHRAGMHRQQVVDSSDMPDPDEKCSCYDDRQSDRHHYTCTHRFPLSAYRLIGRGPRLLEGQTVTPCCATDLLPALAAMTNADTPATMLNRPYT